MSLAKEALAYHRRDRGKIEIRSRAPFQPGDLSLAYTPGVAEPCRAIVENPDAAFELTWKNDTILGVTDGSAVLGLGDIGPLAALPVMEGKAQLLREFGGVNCVPICLATQDPEEIVETVVRISPAYGGVLLEDISAPRCFEIENELQRRLPGVPVFHDDQHGTAVIVLAGLLNAARVVNKKLEEMKFVLLGAGAAGIAIAKILHDAGARNLLLLDSRGICFPGREGMNKWKEEVVALFPEAGAAAGDLETALRGADTFIGISRKDLLPAELVKKMAARAIVFALANPDPEILPPLAKEAGAAVVATGRSDFPNQVNNVLAFPGIFRGALRARRPISEEMKIAAAQALAGLVKSPSAEKILPGAFEPGVAEAVARAVEGV